MTIDHNINERPIQTLARAFADIRAGVEPWVALNEFFHEWFDYSRDQRAALVADPILPSGTVSQLAATQTFDQDDLWRWTVFCAASAEYLCDRYGVARPTWADDPVYTLSEPWYDFDAPGATKPEVRAHLEQTTPEPLRRRNILGGDRVFANKYEFAEMARRLAAAR